MGKFINKVEDLKKKNAHQPEFTQKLVAQVGIVNQNNDVIHKFDKMIIYTNLQSVAYSLLRHILYHRKAEIETSHFNFDLPMNQNEIIDRNSYF